jgi:hypothetical protein
MQYFNNIQLLEFTFARGSLYIFYYPVWRLLGRRTVEEPGTTKKIHCFFGEIYLKTALWDWHQIRIWL